MNNTKYTEKEIEWAINELKKKHPERANREQAISLLDTLKGLPSSVGTRGVVWNPLLESIFRLYQKLRNLNPE